MENKLEQLLTRYNELGLTKQIDYNRLSRCDLTRNRDIIIAFLTENNRLSAASLGKILGVSTKTVEKHFVRLKANGFIERIGPAKGGYWKVK